jgi:hypothetical protein
LGSQNYVRGSIEIYLILVFYYTERNVQVTLFAERFDCDITNWTERFEAIGLLYYTPESLQERNETFEFMLIPESIWNRWLNGEMSGSCEDALWEIYRAIPTTTP